MIKKKKKIILIGHVTIGSSMVYLLGCVTLGATPGLLFCNPCPYRAGQ